MSFPQRQRSGSNASYSAQPTRPLNIQRGPPPPASRTPQRPPRATDRQYAPGPTTSSPEPIPPAPGPRSPNRPLRTRQSYTDDEPTSPTSANPRTMNDVVSALTAAGARRRAMTNGSDDFEYQRERQAEIDSEKQRQQRIRDKMPGRKATRPRAGDIDAVLDQIKDEWEFVIDPDFNNVDLALQLLDDSAQGKDYESFRRTRVTLSKALKGSVDKYYQAFASSLPHHASFLSHLGTTSTQITDTRNALTEAKEALGNKRTDLVQLWSRGQILEEMIRLLDQIDHLKSVPDVLETLISEKRLLQAAVLLVRSLKTINKPDMLEIGAVIDLRSYLQAQESSLRDILIDELHTHLYLKSFWCESRWAVYTPNQTTLPKVSFEDQNPQPVKNTTSTPTSPTFNPTRLNRFINDLGLRSSEPPYDLDNPNFRPITAGHDLPFNQGSLDQQDSNPEADSFLYMETLLESLAVLGKLGSALDTIAQRLPTEIFALIDSTLDEVEDRSAYGVRQSVSFSGPSGPMSVYVFASTFSSSNESTGVSSGGPLDAAALRLAALESSAKYSDRETLRDFFWTLYSKLDAVCQGLRIIYEVSNKIGSRRDFKDSTGAKLGALFPLSEIWVTVQEEVKVLLYDYLTDEQQSTVSRNPISSINEVLREGRFQRDRQKPIFKFVDTALKDVHKTLKPHETELTRSIKETMPGLVQAHADIASSTQSALVSVAMLSDERGLSNQHHRLLIKPDAFHVSVLFQPTLVFLERIAEISPDGVGTSGDVPGATLLDEFVSTVYLPQLEDKVEDLFHEAVTAPDAFLPDPMSTRFAEQPLVKASTHSMALVNSLCTMLQTTPFHRESYARLILGVVIQFYQRCSDRLQDLVTVVKPDETQAGIVALAARWAQRSEVNACLEELKNTKDSNSAKIKALCKQENNVELGLLNQSPVRSTDIIPSIRNLTSLCHLYSSVSWFVIQLSKLKTVAEDALSPTSPLSVEPFSPSAALETPQSPSMAELHLPLSKEMTLRFQALLKTYDQLAALILDTIRIDIRCRVLCRINGALSHENYKLEQEPSGPDQPIIELNTELGTCSDMVGAALPESAQRFVFLGLGCLMEDMLIDNARLMRLVNEHGIRKMLRNIVALQQGVKTITTSDQPEFTRATKYFSLFFMTPPEMVENVRQQRLDSYFSFEELLAMLNFQCGVDGTAGERGKAEAADRNYSMYLIDLHGLHLAE